jgi:hypothetical protein
MISLSYVIHPEGNSHQRHLAEVLEYNARDYLTKVVHHGSQVILQVIH